MHEKRHPQATHHHAYHFGYRKTAFCQACQIAMSVQSAPKQTHPGYSFGVSLNKSVFLGKKLIKTLNFITKGCIVNLCRKGFCISQIYRYDIMYVMSYWFLYFRGYLPPDSIYESTPSVRFQRLPRRPLYTGPWCFRLPSSIHSFCRQRLFRLPPFFVHTFPSGAHCCRTFPGGQIPN